MGQKVTIVVSYMNLYELHSEQYPFDFMDEKWVICLGHPKLLILVSIDAAQVRTAIAFVFRNENERL